MGQGVFFRMEAVRFLTGFTDCAKQNEIIENNCTRIEALCRFAGLPGKDGSTKLTMTDQDSSPVPAAPDVSLSNVAAG
jgi:hypothetical protein